MGARPPSSQTAGGGAAATHSQTLYSVLAHIPGLKCVAPTTAYNAKGFMISAIRDNNPVIVLEHRYLGLNARTPVPEEAYALPFGKAEIVREGSDLTLCGIGRMTYVCLDAAAALVAEGLEAEVIDVLSLAPLGRGDHPRVRREDATPGRRGRRHTVIARWAATSPPASPTPAFDFLDAPIKTINSADTPVPYSAALESIYTPSPQQVVDAVHEMLGTGMKGKPPSQPLPVVTREGTDRPPAASGGPQGGQPRKAIMAVAIAMPNLGMYTIEGEVTRWLVADGASVAADQPVLELTTEKTTVEIPASAAGIIHQVVPVGGRVQVEGILGHILAPGEAPPTATPAAEPPAAAAAAPPRAPAKPPARVGRGRLRATPVARRRARELGVDLTTVTGSGPGGRITEADVQAGRSEHRLPTTTSGERGQWAARTPPRVPLTGMRGLIAQRMQAQSHVHRPADPDPRGGRSPAGASQRVAGPPGQPARGCASPTTCSWPSRWLPPCWRTRRSTLRLKARRSCSWRRRTSAWPSPWRMVLSCRCCANAALRPALDPRPRSDRADRPGAAGAATAQRDGRRHRDADEPRRLPH